MLPKDQEDRLWAGIIIGIMITVSAVYVVLTIMQASYLN